MPKLTLQQVEHLNKQRRLSSMYGDNYTLTEPIDSSFAAPKKRIYKKSRKQKNKEHFNNPAPPRFTHSNFITINIIKHAKLNYKRSWKYKLGAVNSNSPVQRAITRYKALYERKPNSTISLATVYKLLQTGRCFYCGATRSDIQLAFPFKKNSNNVYLEIDRIDSSLPYSNDNCVLACSICNGIKSDLLTKQESLLLGQSIKQIYSLRIKNKS